MVQMKAVFHHSEATLRRRKHLSRTWALLVVGWSLMRALVVWAALSDYGINPVVYLLIDLCSAAVDAYTTPRMVLAFIDNRHKLAGKWAAISLVAFVVPDAYIFLGTGHLPAKVVAIVLTVVTVTFLVAVISVMVKIRKGRAAREALLLQGLDGA